MAVRKLKNSWWVDFRANHMRHRKRSPENSKAGAQAYEALLRQRLARGESIDDFQKQPQMTFGQFTERWYDEYVVPNNKMQEARMKKYRLRSSLIPAFGKLPIEKIASYDIERYKAAMLKTGVSKKTINNNLAVLGACLRKAYEWLQLQGQPPKVPLFKCPPPPIKYLSPDECQLLLSHAEGTTYEMILTALRTGMRQGEIRGLQWSSIDWESGMLMVRHSLNDRTHELETPKSHKERRIPIDIDVLEILHQRKRPTGYVFLDPKERPFDSKRLLKCLEIVREKAKMRPFTWHALRHTFASHLTMKGASLASVQALLGHSTINMTMRYAHVAESSLRDSIALLNPKTAIDRRFGQPVGNRLIDPNQQKPKEA